MKLKRLIPILALSTLSLSTMVSTPDADAKSKYKKTPEIRNVIFLIGDGMGVSYTSAHRYLKNDPTTTVAEKTAFDQYLVGQQMTYPEDPAQNITDSASAATAMSSGVKTYNAAIAVDNDKSEVKTVLEAAKERGKSTGLVATSEITHATPASFGAHDKNRKNMNAIADDYFKERINGKHKIDVLLGGGKSNFVRPDIDLTKAFKKDGYGYVTDLDELNADRNKQVLGLFADGGLPKLIDRENTVPSLEKMTNAAIKRLDTNKKGFFLMVEGSQIDWAGHDNDIVGAMSEMEDFERAFKAAITFAKKDKHTLVVATADHSTGGYSIGADGIYNWFAEPIKAAKKTPDFMAEKIVSGADVRKTLTTYIDQQKLALTEDEFSSVERAAASKKVTDVDNAIEEIFNQRSHTGWTTGGHTGEDVPVYAYGPAKDRFAGQVDNTDHAKIIFDLLKKNK
ncbi:alkaline phosphatase [Exiguobacterium oxidotolerans]|uniref:Alkaline phosphatase III (Promiscuous, heptaprenylglyceryl phosphate is a substrate) n=1 Tax=Exiguobacterium oxidotolerans TaxID=223958 RepID=A0A653II26_9BACL|nr:alkaline phosphatase [Exiguobacterium oxidotolerans]VWX38686.1 alkaline phosphatase III (promiscuous, heptaprenylglyceryl phosphate is a substrate) [Exiguobacterium oxidotolerans]